MKRFKIEVNKNGVAIFDRVQKVYILDASVIQLYNGFTVLKEETKKCKELKGETKYYFTVKTP